MPKAFLILFYISLVFTISCRTRTDEFVTVALPEKFSTFDTLTSTASDAAAERVRNLMFNSLVKKNEKFEYVGELAKEIKSSEEGKVVTFILQDNVKFHNGKDFTSADVKYTFDELFKSNGFKAGAFADTVDEKRVPHIVSIQTPDPKTVIFTLSRASLQNQLLSNLVAIPIIAEGTVEQQKTQPVGTGAFKFVGFDQSQNIVELAANPDYYEGTPKVPKLRIKTVIDANSLQAELQSGNVDIAPLPTNLAPDTLKSLDGNPSLKVEQFNGSNIQYLQFNTQSEPLNNVKLRQAIAYGIDREKIINELLFGQATIAHSILPVESWAYNAGTKYSFDAAKAKQLLQESGYKGEPIKFKFASSNVAFNQYSQVIQNALKEIGINVEIEPLDPNVLRQQISLGQFQMNTGIWVGGNQDPIFLNDLFTTKKIPSEKPKVSCCNRSRYSNPEVDKIIEQAFNSTNREQAKELYFKAQEIISSDVPMFPLWYPANMVVANKRIGNIKISPSGDWSFIKNITADGK
ncbi:MAG: ABC transporter substrate-binding protein [Pyrinomonadaceae bacterium]|nr:ABC transporter substrate-binding protein [Pyrinomonadaceae bacterium]